MNNTETNLEDLDVPRSSADTKSGKLTRCSAANNDLNDETIAHQSQRSNGKLRKLTKRARPLAADDECDIEETAIKKQRLSHMGTSGEKRCAKSLGSEKNSDHEASSRRTSRGERDNGEEQEGLESDFLSPFFLCFSFVLYSSERPLIIQQYLSYTEHFTT
jgi:hypothetical protein